MVAIIVAVAIPGVRRLVVKDGAPDTRARACGGRGSRMMQASDHGQELGGLH